jgi:hypothetical protein
MQGTIMAVDPDVPPLGFKGSISPANVTASCHWWLMDVEIPESEFVGVPEVR